MAISPLRAQIDCLFAMHGWNIVAFRVPAGRTEEVTPLHLPRSREDLAAGRPVTLPVEEDRRLRGDLVVAKLANGHVARAE